VAPIARFRYALESLFNDVTNDEARELDQEATKSGAPAWGPIRLNSDVKLVAAPSPRVRDCLCGDSMAFRQRVHERVKGTIATSRVASDAISPTMA
jgi:hypothetical protein